MKALPADPYLSLASFRIEFEKRKIAETERNAVEIRERCSTLAGFVREAWPYIDPADYVHNWHIDAICEHLEAVTFGKLTRLIINIPPRHMKSLLVSVAWPAWIWTLERTTALSGPSVGFLATSYAHSLSVRDNVKCRRLIESPWYRTLWGSAFALTGDQNTKIRFENNQGGYRIASSIDGTATGEGGDIVTVDDAISAKDARSEVERDKVNDWWDTVMSTRLNDPKTGAYVAVMQRIHENDLVGHILAHTPGEYTHLCLPARYDPDHPFVWPRDPRTEKGELLWPHRMGEAEVSKLETSLGSYGTAGQLQQLPAPSEGGMFKRRWFEIVAAAPANLRKARHWDLAATVAAHGKDPDWTVGALIGRCDNGFFWILDLVRFRGSAHEVETAILNTAKQDTTKVTIGLPQDPGQAGKAQIGALTRMLAGWTVKSAPESGSKEVRASPFASQCEAGNVKMVKASWNDAFLNEIEVFPFGAHDDVVDASSGSFNMLADSGDAQSWVQFMKAEAERRRIPNPQT